MTTQQAELQPPSLAVKKLEKAARQTRKVYLEADATLYRARADMRLNPSHHTLEAVDLAERHRRQTRNAWLTAVDDLEVAQSGGRA